MSANANAKEIYDLLLEEPTVSVRFSDRKQAERLRIALAKRHAVFRAAGIVENSLCLEWKADSGIATYRIGAPVRARCPTFEILSNDSPSKTLPKDRYKILWEKIRSSLEPVEVSCPKGAQERVINRMQKYKCRINVARRSMGLAGFGKLKIERKGDVISFFIETNGELF